MKLMLCKEDNSIMFNDNNIIEISNDIIRIISKDKISVHIKLLLMNIVLQDFVIEYTYENDNGDDMFLYILNFVLYFIKYNINNESKLLINHNINYLRINKDAKDILINIFNEIFEYINLFINTSCIVNL
jgi:hypothetical protein